MRKTEKHDIMKWSEEWRAKFLKDFSRSFRAIRSNVAEISLMYSAMEAYDFEVEAVEKENQRIKSELRMFVDNYDDLCNVFSEYTNYVVAHAHELAEDLVDYDVSRKSDTQVRLAVLRLTDGSCAYCGIKLGSDWHVDHVVPVSKGGPDSFENYVPSCPSCNVSKNGEHVVEFIKRRFGNDKSIEDGGTVVNFAGANE